MLRLKAFIISSLRPGGSAERVRLKIHKPCIWIQVPRDPKRASVLTDGMRYPNMLSWDYNAIFRNSNTSNTCNINIIFLKQRNCKAWIWKRYLRIDSSFATLNHEPMHQCAIVKGRGGERNKGLKQQRKEATNTSRERYNLTDETLKCQ